MSVAGSLAKVLGALCIFFLKKESTLNVDVPNH